jgi:L-threonylcarbamoyladenylate synthase
LVGDVNAFFRTQSLPTDDPLALRRAVVALQRGQVIAFPTDTVYGIGAHAFMPRAVAGLYTVKGRPEEMPIPLLLPDISAIDWVCVDVPALAWQFAERFWPGGLSLVLHRAPVVPDILTAGGSTVAVRLPDHNLVRDLCRVLEAPLAATSANPHGAAAPVTAAEVGAALAGRIPLILDGGRCPGGVASTVLDLTVSPPAILRAGPITVDQLAAVVPVQA